MNRLIHIFASYILLQVISYAQLPAFPGAEGFGSIASGGRGGDVYYVTNLNASGAGSFAYGVQNAPSAGRTIVFAVSGHIRLPSGSGGGLTIANHKITVAGQTAPGDGICFWNNTMNITGNDLVFRNIRWRYGKQAAGGDAVDISGSQRIIFDHCDMMFSTDENMSSFGTAPEHMTFQWSTNAWGLQGHSCGGLWKMKHATVHHSLWANNHTRNPKLIGCDVFDWVNNLTFGWDYGFNMAPEITGGLGYTYRVNIRNSTFSHASSTTTSIYGGGLNDDGTTKFQLHMADTALDGNNNGTLDVSRTNFSMVSATDYTQVATPWPQTTNGNPANPLIGTAVNVVPRLTAYKKILSQSGATRMDIGTRPLRDEITSLCITRTANLQRNIISDPLELNLSTGTAFANLQSETAPSDTDLDGMPDEWETAVGYDQTTPDHNTTLTSTQTAASFFPPGTPTGYTRLEEYLHFMAVPHGTIPKNTADSPVSVDIDLRKYTTGFTANPVFTISGITNGTITQSGTGNAIVHFTPPLNTSGRAGFKFTVTDATGDTWTQQCCLLISTHPQPRPITWVGDSTLNQWDTSSNNFTSILGTTAFTNGDAVTIDDTGSISPTLKVTGLLSPASISVDNTTKNYTLEGTGSFSGTGGISKTGAGTLTLRINHTGTGTSLIEGGKIILGGASNIGALPTGKITLSKNATITNAWPNSTSTQNITAPLHISSGETATIQTGRRIYLSGAVTGEGTLNITHQGTDGTIQLRGAMNAFAGKLNFTYSGTNPALSAVFNGGSFNGWSAASVQLPAPLVLACTTNSTGNTFAIGELAGSGTLGGGSSGSPNYTIGALNTDSSFSGSFTGNAKVTKTGTGILTLSGNSTHSAATTINSGALALSGTFGNSPVTVATGATLTGNGTLAGSLTTTAAAILSPGANNGYSPGTLTTASLNLVSPDLLFDLSNNPLTNNDHIQVTGGGPITISGPQNFIFKLTNGNLSPGTYDLLTTTGVLTANGATLQSNLPSATRQTLNLEHSPTGTSPGYIHLVVTGTQGNLTWTGSNGSIWDQQTTPSWTGASPATFFNFDNVTFNDTATNGTVTISQPVAPQSITINNTAARPYTFTGAPITGSTSLVKSGSGPLTLNVLQYTLANSSLTTGSPSVAVSSTTGLFPGMTVIGSGIPTNTTITAIPNGTTLTLSQNATATSTTTSLIIETRNTFTGGTILNDGTLTLACNTWQYYSSANPSPSNAWGLGSGPITLNGGTLTLLGHTVDTRYLSGALPNDLIVPAGKTATLRSTMRGTYLGDIAALRGSLTGSGTLNLVVNYAYGAIVGDWSAFSGTLNVTRPASGANDPRFQLGYDAGMPLAHIHLDQASLTYTATPPTDGITIPLGNLSGTDTTTTLIAGAQSSSAPVTWRVGGLNANSTYAGNFTPYTSGGPIGLEKIGTGTWTLTGTGTVSAGITIEQGILSYGDAATDVLSGTSDIAINPNATLQLNSGAKIIGSSCEILTGGTLRGIGTLQAPLNSTGTLALTGGTLNLKGNTDIAGSIVFSSLSDRLAITGNLNLAGTLQLPSTGITAGRKLLITYTGTLSLADLTIQNIPTNYLATLDTATSGEIAVILQDQSLYFAWQTLHFGNLTNPNGLASADPDNDGMTNQEEFEANTDPNDAASFVPLIWQGGGTNPWDLATTINWLENTTPRVFRNQRQVTINDNGTNTPAINLIGTLAPSALTITNSSKPFTLSGTGTLTGSTGLAKSGTNTLTIALSNSYTGATSIDAGVLNIQHPNALGSASSGTTITTNARLELEGGITVPAEPLNLSGTGGASFYNGALNSKSGINTWAGPLAISSPGTRIGAQAGATLIVSGPISSSTGVTFRPNDMTSTVILSSANAYTGDTTCIGGVLKLGATNALPIATTLKLGSSNASGKLDLGGYNQQLASILVTQTSGTYTNEITSSTPAILTVNLNSNATYSGKLTGSLTLAKSGSATLALSSTSALATTTTVHLDNGILNLSAPHTITALRINGIWQPAGTYSAANSSGRISGSGSLIVSTSGPSAFVAWMDSFLSLSANDKLPTADPDHDGQTNLAEFAFAGNPTSASDTGLHQLRTNDSNGNSLPDLTLTLEVRTGTIFVASGPDLVSPAIDGILYRIEGSTDLSSYNSPITEVTPHLGSGSPHPGYSFKTFRLNASEALLGRGFIRAQVSQP